MLVAEKNTGISVGQGNGDVHVHVAGRGTFQNGQPLRRYAVEMIGQGARQFVVDLGQCEGMDSTFLGVLAGIGLQPPTPDYAEQVFYHDLKADNEGNTCVALINKNLEIGVAIHFSKNQLFNFTQWKQMGEGDYVMGMEPCNCYVGGRIDPRNATVREYLEPGEIRNFDLTIELLSGLGEINAMIKKIENLK